MITLLRIDNIGDHRSCNLLSNLSYSSVEYLAVYHDHAIVQYIVLLLLNAVLNRRRRTMYCTIPLHDHGIA